MNTVAENINCLGSFLGRRDFTEMTPEALYQTTGLKKVDIMVLFGGSIAAGGDLLAEAMRKGIAEKYLIVGGEGHTTESLRQRIHAEIPSFETKGLPEAEVFNGYLRSVYQLEADALETRSTNCGNNITYLLKRIDELQLSCRSVLLCQDATMQLRMDAGMRKFAPQNCRILNFATYHAEVEERNGVLQFREPIHGMWSVDRYVNLLMGEIPRLRDDKDGYGPNGKDFIAHTELPEDVLEAFHHLQEVYGTRQREANPQYASI